MPNHRADGVRVRCVAFPDELWEAVKDQAAKYETTASDIVRTAVRGLLDEEPA